MSVTVDVNFSLESFLKNKYMKGANAWGTCKDCNVEVRWTREKVASHKRAKCTCCYEQKEQFNALLPNKSHTVQVIVDSPNNQSISLMDESATSNVAPEPSNSAKRQKTIGKRMINYY